MILARLAALAAPLLRRLPGGLVAAALWLALPGQAAADANACAVIWQVQPQLQASPAHLVVRLQFNGGNRQRTLLHLPGGWAEHQPADSTTAARLQAVPDEPAWRSVAHTAGETVQLQWRVMPDPDPARGGHLKLGAGWLAFTGGGVLPLPDGLDDASAATPNPTSAAATPACIALDGLDASGRWATSHGLAEGGSALFRLAVGGAPLAQRVQQGLYAGGNLQWQATPTVTAVMPQPAPWAFGIGDVAGLASEALAAQRRHWQGPAAAAEAGPPWLVLLLPAPAGAVDTGLGSAWHQAVALQLPANGQLARHGTAAPAPGEAPTPPRLDALVAQALARAWVAERFGPLAHAGRGDGGLRAWFSEGWSDYLAHRSLLRDGLWTPDDYARALTRQINHYLAEPARNLPNAPLAASSTLAPRLAALQAARGEWLALQWQQALRRQGHPGLDTVLRRLLVPAAQARREGPISAPLATHRLVAALRPALQDQPLRDLQLHIEQGQPFSFGPDSLGPCFNGRRVAAADGATLPAGIALMDYQPLPQALQQPACQAWLGLGAAADAQDAGPAPVARGTVATGTGAAKGRKGSKARGRQGGTAGAAPGVRGAGKAGAKAPGKTGGKPVVRSPAKASAKAVAKPSTKAAVKKPAKAR